MILETIVFQKLKFTKMPKTRNTLLEYVILLKFRYCEKATKFEKIKNIILFLKIT